MSSYRDLILNDRMRWQESRWQFLDEFAVTNQIDPAADTRPRHPFDLELKANEPAPTEFQRLNFGPELP